MGLKSGYNDDFIDPATTIEWQVAQKLHFAPTKSLLDPTLTSYLAENPGQGQPIFMASCTYIDAAILVQQFGYSSNTPREFVEKFNQELQEIFSHASVVMAVMDIARYPMPAKDPERADRDKQRSKEELFPFDSQKEFTLDEQIHFPSIMADRLARQKFFTLIMRELLESFVTHNCPTVESHLLVVGANLNGDALCHRKIMIQDFDNDHCSMTTESVDKYLRFSVCEADLSICCILEAAQKHLYPERNHHIIYTRDTDLLAITALHAPRWAQQHTFVYVRRGLSIKTIPDSFRERLMYIRDPPQRKPGPAPGPSDGDQPAVPAKKPRTISPTAVLFTDMHAWRTRRDLYHPQVAYINFLVMVILTGNDFCEGLPRAGIATIRKTCKQMLSEEPPDGVAPALDFVRWDGHSPHLEAPYLVERLSAFIALLVKMTAKNPPPPPPPPRLHGIINRIHWNLLYYILTPLLGTVPDALAQDDQQRPLYGFARVVHPESTPEFPRNPIVVRADFLPYPPPPVPDASDQVMVDMEERHPPLLAPPHIAAAAAAAAATAAAAVAAAAAADTAPPPALNPDSDPASADAAPVLGGVSAPEPSRPPPPSGGPIYARCRSPRPAASPREKAAPYLPTSRTPSPTGAISFVE